MYKLRCEEIRGDVTVTAWRLLQGDLLLEWWTQFSPAWLQARNLNVVGQGLSSKTP